MKLDALSLAGIFPEDLEFTNVLRAGAAGSA